MDEKEYPFITIEKMITNKKNKDEIMPGIISNNITCLDAQFTPNLETIILNKIFMAARNCYHGSEPIMNIVTTPYKEKTSYVKRIVDSGHLSVIEHVQLTFQINKISRIASHQLVRHRLASYTHQSLRYSDAGNMSFMIPNDIAKNEEAMKLVNSAMNYTSNFYEELKKLGFTKDDSRFMLPMNIETSMSFSMNLRTLKHFFNERCCFKASDEINRIAWSIRNYLVKWLPYIFDNQIDGPKCMTLKRCPESKSCGMYDSMNRDKNIGSTFNMDE